MNDRSTKRNIVREIAEALRITAASAELSGASRECFTNNTIFGLYAGNLSYNRRQKALAHMVKGHQCCIDLDFYYDIFFECIAKRISVEV